MRNESKLIEQLDHTAADQERNFGMRVGVICIAVVDDRLLTGWGEVRIKHPPNDLHAGQFGANVGCKWG